MQRIWLQVRSLFISTHHSVSTPVRMALPHKGRMEVLLYADGRTCVWHRFTDEKVFVDSDAELHYADSKGL